MKRFGVWLLAALLLFMLLPVIGQAEEITYTGVVNTKSLHLRKEPNASAKVLNTYARGKEVTILENDGTWCLVQIGTKTTGYMMTKYLMLGEVFFNAEDDTIVVDRKRLEDVYEELGDILGMRG